jgi:hypothetical protein
MATTLKQINAELDKYYAPDRQLYQGQLDRLPGQYDAQASGLDAKLQQANTNILTGARSRGLGFSGIPLQEQAQYAATDYAPALANLRTQQEQTRTGILQSLNGLARERNSQATALFNDNRNYDLQQRQFKESQRQFNENLKLQREAAARAGGGGGGGDYLGGLGDIFGGGGGGSAPGAPAGVQAKMSQRKGGGFNFTIGGKAVSAATYAKATKTPFRNLLSTMAKNGDAGAKLALGFVGNDYGYDRKKINSAQAANIYNALVWGSGRSAKYTPAKKAAPYKPYVNPTLGLSQFGGRK